MIDTNIETIPHQPLLPTEEVSVKDTFGLKLSKDITVTAFTKPGKLTPEIDSSYVFPKEETVMFLMSLEHRDPTYIKGHSGTGKTQLVRQVAARLNYNVVQINFDGNLARPDLIGEPRISRDENGNATQSFRYGLVPLGFTEPGTLLLLDEVDACPPETAFVLQRAVSEDLQFLMHETNELFTLHPQSMIVATANTTGQGDTSGLYLAGTNIQNFSFLNRWKTTIELAYLPEEVERKMLSSRFPSFSKAEISATVAVVQAVRAAFVAGTVSMPLTTRDAINWMDKMKYVSKPMLTAKYSFLNRYPTSEAMALAEIIQRYWELPEDDDARFTSRMTKKVI